MKLKFLLNNKTILVADSLETIFSDLNTGELKWLENNTHLILKLKDTKIRYL